MGKFVDLHSFGLVGLKKIGPEERGRGVFHAGIPHRDLDAGVPGEGIRPEQVGEKSQRLRGAPELDHPGRVFGQHVIAHRKRVGHGVFGEAEVGHGKGKGVDRRRNVESPAIADLGAEGIDGQEPAAGRGFVAEREGQAQGERRRVGGVMQDGQPPAPVVGPRIGVDDLLGAVGRAIEPALRGAVIDDFYLRGPLPCRKRHPKAAAPAFRDDGDAIDPNRVYRQGFEGQRQRRQRIGVAHVEHDVGLERAGGRVEPERQVVVLHIDAGWGAWGR